jgi:hypothetical protein
MVLIRLESQSMASELPHADAGALSLVRQNREECMIAGFPILEMEVEKRKSRKSRKSRKHDNKHDKKSRKTRRGRY